MSNSNLHIKKYGVNAAHQRVANIVVAEDAEDIVSINGNTYVKGGTPIGTLTVEIPELEIDPTALPATLDDVEVVIKNDGEVLDTITTSITIKEEE